MLIKYAISAVLAAMTFFLTTRMLDGSFCWFYRSAESPGICGAPVVYFGGYLVAAAIAAWGLWDLVRRPSRGK